MSTSNQSWDECPSICIPRMFKHISVSFIIDIFQNKLKLGVVKKVAVIPNNADKNFKKVFVHFDFWHDNVYINRCNNDYGPATKLLGLNEMESKLDNNTIILVTDDDNIKKLIGLKF